MVKRNEYHEICDEIRDGLPLQWHCGMWIDNARKRHCERETDDNRYIPANSEQVLYRPELSSNQPRFIAMPSLGSNDRRSARVNAFATRLCVVRGSSAGAPR
jgi:hypothetical protein